MSSSMRKMLRRTLGFALMLLLFIGQTTLAQQPRRTQPAPKRSTLTGDDLILGNERSGQQFIFHARTGNNADFLQITFDTTRGNRLNNWSWGEGLVLQRGGNVGIGITTPEHKLSVAGTIKAKELSVSVENWPDYVFADDYDLPSLEDVEAYIDQHKHLPGIPTAHEVEANGIAVGEMNARLLQKVEELTLHLLDMKHDQDALKAENEHLRTRLARLEAKRQ